MSATETTWAGADELRAFLVPVDDIHPHEENPRRGDIELVKTSLGKFGQLKPVILDRDERDRIVAGNHTYLAARELGWTHIAAVEMWEGAEEGMKYLLMDNRTSDASTYDRAELLSMLDSYQGDGLVATGFTEEERDAIRADLEAERQAAEEFAAGAAETAPARTETAKPGTLVRNVLLTFDDPDRFRDFGTKLNVLRREWSTIDVSACIADALRRETQRLHRGDD